MKILEIINRDHNFSNRIDMVEKTSSSYRIHREKSPFVAIKRNSNLDDAFDNKNWDAFELAEQRAIESMPMRETL